MEKFIKGDVVVIPFPFSDLTSSKRRPALVLANLDGEDIVLCQITSQNTRDIYAIPIDNTDMTEGTLPVLSNIRPTRLFTADKKLILYRLGRISSVRYREVTEALIQLIAL